MLSIVPESCLRRSWTSPFSLQEYPGTGNAEVSAALDLEGGDRQNRSGTDWAPDDQLHHRQGLKGWCMADSNNLSTRQYLALLLLGLLVPDPCLAQVACHVQGELGWGHRTKCFSHGKLVTCIGNTRASYWLWPRVSISVGLQRELLETEARYLCREKMTKERKRTAALRVEWFGSPEDLVAFCNTERWRENPAFTCFRGGCQRNKGSR